MSDSTHKNTTELRRERYRRAAELLRHWGLEDSEYDERVGAILNEEVKKDSALHLAGQLSGAWSARRSMSRRGSIRDSSSPAPLRPSVVHGNCTSRTTAFGVRWRIASRNSNFVCSRTARVAARYGPTNCGCTIRAKLPKIGAAVTITVRKVWVQLASACPYWNVFARVRKNLRDWGSHLSPSLESLRRSSSGRAENSTSRCHAPRPNPSAAKTETITRSCRPAEHVRRIREL